MNDCTPRPSLKGSGVDTTVEASKSADPISDYNTQVGNLKAYLSTNGYITLNADGTLANVDNDKISEAMTTLGEYNANQKFMEDLYTQAPSLKSSGDGATVEASKSADPISDYNTQVDNLRNTLVEMHYITVDSEGMLLTVNHYSLSAVLQADTAQGNGPE